MKTLLQFLCFSLICVNVVASDENSRPVHQPEMFAPTDSALIPESRIQDIFPECPSEMAAHLKYAKALKFDIPLVKRDFPFMREWNAERIYKWFEAKGALVSLEQVKQTVVNTEIHTTGEFQKVYRPPGYGRAVIVEYEEDGYKGAFEVKMSGVGPGHTPSHRSHGNGLGTLGEVMREDLFENATRASISHANRLKISQGEISNLGGTVAGYGYMYAGYDVRHPDGSTTPAGIYIRQAHRRISYNEDIRAAWLPGELKSEILKHISKYGFYTGWESNIQGLVKDGKVFVFDFGHWIAWRGEVVEANTWVHSEFALNFDIWGWDWYNGPNRDFDQWRTSRLDKPFNWTEETARAVKQVDGQKYIIQTNDNFLLPELKKLKVGISSKREIVSGMLCKQIF